MVRLLPLALPLVESWCAIALCVVAGWPIARLSTADRLMRLLIAALVGYFLYYQIDFAGYAFGFPLPAAPLASLGLSMSAAAWISSSGKRRREFLATFHGEAMLLWFAVICFALGLQAALVGCGAGSWGNDWHEHFSRTLLFSEHRSPATTFSAMRWTVPARGPLFNATCAVFFGLFGDQFWNYQVFSTALNTTSVLAVAAALRDFAGIRERSALLMSAVFVAISPFAVTEIAYPWTKLLTVAYILCALRFFLIALEAPSDGRSLLWSSFFFALGILTHYYVAIPALICGAYWFARRRLEGSRGAAAAAAVGVLTVAPWILYCLITFGFSGTFASNSTVRSATAGGAPYPVVVAGNLLSSTLPVSVRHDLPAFAQSRMPVLLAADSSGRWVELPEEKNELTLWMLDLINGNFSILGTLGLAGMFAVLFAALAWDRDRQRLRLSVQPAPPVSGPTEFWAALLPAGVLLTVMSYPQYADNGLRGAGLHVYILLIAVLAVRHLRGAPRPVLVALGALFLIESAIGSGAFVALQSRPVPLRLTDAGFVAEPGAAVDPLYIKNYALKLESGLVFLSDYFGPARFAFSLLATVLSLGAFAWAALQTPKQKGAAPPVHTPLLAGRSASA